MSKTIRIGTRESELALWQANTVKDKLDSLGYSTELVPIKSQGDIQLDKPLYELGITGIFTKTLDIAMLNGDVDIAVHSMKDVPTALPKGIIQTAVLERGEVLDILISKENTDLQKECTIATGSLRRTAQWLNRYPHHKLVDLRGNVNTRLQKLHDNPWEGAIFAKAGLERISLLPESYTELDWMIPAPAQGAMVVVALENDPYSVEATSQLNHNPSSICTKVERDFLRKLEGGCTAPIGALATISEDKIDFRGVLLNVQGDKVVKVEKRFNVTEAGEMGALMAAEVLESGGIEIMNELKAED